MLTQTPRSPSSLHAHTAPRAHGQDEHSSYECGLCGDTVAPEGWVEHRDLENFVLLEIRRLHPEWIERDGACRRCIRVYRSLGRAHSTLRRWWRRAA